MTDMITNGSGHINIIHIVRDRERRDTTRERYLCFTIPNVKITIIIIPLQNIISDRP